jgi:phosphatidate cytidylyltransferase
MKRVLTAVALIPVVLLIVFKAPLWLFALVVAVIIVLALHEYLNIAEAAGAKPFHWITYSAALIPTLLFWYQLWKMKSDLGSSVAPFNLFISDALIVRVCGTLLVLSPVIFGIPLVFRKDLKTGLAASASSILGVAYLGVSLSLLTALRSAPFERLLVVFILFSVWSGDIAAYYVGRAIGRHKLAPIVSPNKSWEGAIASVVASVLIGIIIFHFRDAIERMFPEKAWGTNLFYAVPQPEKLPFFSVWWVHVVILGMITNIAAQFGDLFESALKRGAGVKDSGTILPGHGGLLDRIDALLFAIPVVWYYADLTGFLLPKFLP